MSISVESLSRSFGQDLALDGVSFTVPKNTFFCVVGLSGCGISTLLRLIAGLESPDTGRIFLHGDCVFGDRVNLPPEDR